MKKLLATFVLAFLFVGCGTASQQSFLDEKIKCKKLADVRIEELKKNNPDSFLDPARYNYAAEFDICVLEYNLIIGSSEDYWIDSIIENLLTNEELAYKSDKSYSEWMNSGDESDSALWQERMELWDKQVNEFSEKMKLYFGEDAE